MDHHGARWKGEIRFPARGHVPHHGANHRAGAGTPQRAAAGHEIDTRMREYGSVSIPQEAFIAALRMGDEG